MYKPRISGPKLQVVKPKEYELYNERDVDTIIELKKLNDQIDALNQENEQLLLCCKGQGAGSRRFRKHARVRKGTALRRNGGGRRTRKVKRSKSSKKRPTAHRRRSSKARNARNTRRR